ncbi:MAG TPA: hypothetical protein VMV73_04780 [Candidatus Dormibacteraeota bacterium]|nr:hypothetical protein [Candidatus Dormibacteraeota bacterium]
MEHFFVTFAKDAAWAIAILFLFAVIGIVATVRWIIGLFMKAEHAVESGVQSVEGAITHRDR